MTTVIILLGEPKPASKKDMQTGKVVHDSWPAGKKLMGGGNMFLKRLIEFDPR